MSTSQKISDPLLSFRFTASLQCHGSWVDYELRSLHWYNKWQMVLRDYESLSQKRSHLPVTMSWSLMEFARLSSMAEKVHQCRRVNFTSQGWIEIFCLSHDLQRSVWLCKRGRSHVFSSKIRHHNLCNSCTACVKPNLLAYQFSKCYT
jgi:hypothetical protein